MRATEDTVKAAFSAMQDFPHGHAALITALDELLTPPEIVIIRGDKNDADTWARNIDAIYAPRRLVFSIPADAQNLPDALDARKAEDRTIAYICRGTSCSAPVRSIKELAAELSEAGNLPDCPQTILSGSERSLCPVSANSAFATAGAITGVPGSPIPAGSNPPSIINTSISGESASLSIR